MKTEELNTSRNSSLLMGSRIVEGGAVFFRDAPPNPPPNCQVLPGSQERRGETSGTGEYGRVESGKADQALVGDIQIRAASEGPLSLMVAVDLDA